MAELRDTLSGSVSLVNELIMQRLEPILVQAGLTMSTFDLLSTVRAAGKSASQAEVARMLGITPPSLSEAVKAAVKGGFVEQVPSSVDARVKVLKLTGKGFSRLDKVIQSLNVVETELVNGINSSELRTTVKVLINASHNLARVLQET